MKNLPRLMGVVALVAAFALVAAACGDDTAAEEPAPAAAEPGALPLDENPSDTPAIAAGCAVGEPDCNDTPDVGGSELPPPPDDAEPVTPSGMLVDGGLSVADALATDATGVIAVQGLFFDDGNGARLCEVLAESFPPQCGGASIPVAGYEEVIALPLNTAQGVTWTDGLVTFLGEVVDGTLVVDPTVAG